MNQAKLAGGRRIQQNERGSKTIIKSAAQNNYLNSVKILNTKIIDMKDNDYLKFRDFSIGTSCCCRRNGEEMILKMKKNLKYSRKTG